MSVYAPTQAPDQSKPVLVKSSSAVDGQSLRAPTVHRHRKTVSTGGGRAWSDAEEAYLIETREHKMPYKHIATQLKKTELACRLHYHQLSFGSKSRRQPSLPAYDRQSAPPAEKLRYETPTTQQRTLPSFSPPASPPENQAMEYSPRSQTPQSNNNNKPLLPKPVPSNHHPHHSHHRRTPTNNTNHKPPHKQPLHLITTSISPHPEDHQNQYIDLPRLQKIYDSHRLHFWSTIARSYGCNLSPAALEEAWCRAHGMSGSSRFPPTPRGSPQASSLAPSSAAPYSALSAPPAADVGRGFTPVNSSGSGEGVGLKVTPSGSSTRAGSFSVSSLLTEDKEVRLSPGAERRGDDVEMES